MGFVTDGGYLVFTGIKNAGSDPAPQTETVFQVHSLVALFTEKRDNGTEFVLKRKKNDLLGPFLLYDIFYSYSVRFLLKEDTVSLFIIIAGGLFLSGLVLTFLQKKGDKKL